MFGLSNYPVFTGFPDHVTGTFLENVLNPVVWKGSRSLLVADFVCVFSDNVRDVSQQEAMIVSVILHSILSSIYFY